MPSELIAVEFPDGHVEDMTESQYAEAKGKYSWLSDSNLKEVTEEQYQAWKRNQALMTGDCQCVIIRRMTYELRSMSQQAWSGYNVEVAAELCLDGVVRLVSQLQEPIPELEKCPYCREVARLADTATILEKLNAWLNPPPKSSLTSPTASPFASRSLLSSLWNRYHTLCQMTPMLALYRLRRMIQHPSPPLLSRA